MRCLLFLILSFFMTVQAQTQVTFAIGDWAPYVHETEVGSKIIEHIVTEAFALRNIDAQFAYYPWRRSFELVKVGNYVGTFPWNKTPTRAESFIIHKEPLLNDENVFFHLKETNFDWQEMSDLSEYLVGVVNGYNQVEIYDNLGIPAVIVDDEATMFRMLATKRVEVFQTSKVVGKYFIRTMFPPKVQSQFTHHPTPGEGNQYFVLFSQHNEQSQFLADELDIGLRALKESPRFAEILQGN